jgi:hypothetical protein
MIMSDETPLIWTSKGNLPISDLEYSMQWAETEDYIKFIETYKQDDEIVKQSVHTLLKKGLPVEVEQGSL